MLDLHPNGKRLVVRTRRAPSDDGRGQRARLEQARAGSRGTVASVGSRGVIEALLVEVVPLFADRVGAGQALTDEPAGRFRPEPVRDGLAPCGVVG